VDAAFEAQYRTMKAAMAARERPADIEIAFTPAGEVDYIYEVGRLLALDVGPTLELLNRYVGTPVPGRREEGGLVELTLDGISVPDALAAVRREDRARSGAGPDAAPIRFSPNHLVHVTRLCAAVEPEVPSSDPAAAPRVPWPPTRPGEDGRGVLIGICDTGLLENLDVAGRFPWLAGVTGEPDVLPPVGRTGEQRILAHQGHGTFCAGVARGTAPGAAVHVADHLTLSGGELESVFCAKLADLLALDPSPGILSISAGTYTAGDLPPLAFEQFRAWQLARHPGVVLVASAGNDRLDRPLWPAAFDWAVSVGALGPDERHRAWFSNGGPTVDVHALGEGMVNAFAEGVYTYQEQPKVPARQTFTGMARWDGTSFSTPLVAGLIAARMSREGESGVDAAAAVLRAARGQAIDGVGPVLLTTDRP
jgi:subtilisin family serine protease